MNTSSVNCRNPIHPGGYTGADKDGSNIISLLSLKSLYRYWLIFRGTNVVFLHTAGSNNGTWHLPYIISCMKEI